MRKTFLLRAHEPLTRAVTFRRHRPCSKCCGASTDAAKPPNEPPAPEGQNALLGNAATLDNSVDATAEFVQAAHKFSKAFEQAVMQIAGSVALNPCATCPAFPSKQKPKNKHKKTPENPGSFYHI